MLVREVMTRQPVTVTRDTSVKEVLETLERHRITATPVLDARGQVEGVVSEADLIRELVPPDERTHQWPAPGAWHDRPSVVGDVMSLHPVTVGPDTDLAAAVELITTLSVTCVPVVDQHHGLVGMLSLSDILRVLAHSDEDIERRVGTGLTEVGLGDWLVTVTNGEVELSGPDGSPYRMTAHVVAESVPGVVGVLVRT